MQGKREKLPFNNPQIQQSSEETNKKQLLKEVEKKKLTP